MNTPKVISFFISSMSDGGAERVTLNLVNNLARRYPYEVDLVLASASGPFVNQIDEKVTVVDLEAANTRSSLFKLSRYIRTRRPIAVVAAMHHANIVALIANKICFNHSTKVIATLHINLSISLENPTNIRGKYILPAIRITYRWAHAIVGVSQGVVDDFLKHVESAKPNISVIFNPVITAELKRKSKHEVNHRWLQDKSKQTVLAAGRLGKQKNFELLIDAFKLIENETTASLLILGEGDSRKLLQKRIIDYELESRIELIGFVENPYAYMSQANVFVMSSIFEGLPTVLIEALYCGATLVSTDCPSGPREILNDGEFGTLVPTQDIVALSQGILDALQHPKNPAGERAWLPYEEDHVADQYLNIVLN